MNVFADYRSQESTTVRSHRGDNSLLLNNTTDQIVRRVISRYLVKGDPPLTDSLEWVRVMDEEDACFLLGELNQEFGTKLFRGHLTPAAVDEIRTVGKLIAYIERKIRRQEEI